MINGGEAMVIGGLPAGISASAIREDNRNLERVRSQAPTIS